MISEETRRKMSESAKTRGMFKICPDCGESDREKFYLDKNGNKTNAHCRDCHKKRCNVRWHSMSPLEKQGTRVLNLYGLTKEQYYEMYEKQQGKCAICEEEPKTKRLLHVDHCHSTGIIRGLLCSQCNTALGSFRDNPTLLNRAIEYLGRNENVCPKSS